MPATLPAKFMRPASEAVCPWVGARSAGRDQTLAFAKARLPYESDKRAIAKIAEEVTSERAATVEKRSPLTMHPLRAVVRPTPLRTNRSAT
jgi:hypothetical protein